MSVTDAFSYLGIPIVKNVTLIKNAYRKALPQHHPEEDPEGFMQLHEAYKTALAFAQGTSYATSAVPHNTWSQTQDPPSKEESAFDDLFTDLNKEDAAVLPQQKKVFLQKILWLRLHWLPLSFKAWAKFFDSEIFLLCRRDPECMEKLYELLKVKIHTYYVFLFLISRLWETANWQRSEELEAQANKTITCISELNTQYGYYLKRNPDANVFFRILPALWYYQALPFYFKMVISTFLLPILSFGSGDVFINMLLIFYIGEISISIRKMSHNLGIFYPTFSQKAWVQRFNISGNKGLLLVVGIYTFLFHIFLCAGVWENLYH